MGTPAVATSAPSVNVGVEPGLVVADRQAGVAVVAGQSPTGLGCRRLDRAFLGQLGEVGPGVQLGQHGLCLGLGLDDDVAQAQRARCPRAPRRTAPRGPRAREQGSAAATGRRPPPGRSRPSSTRAVAGRPRWRPPASSGQRRTPAEGSRPWSASSSSAVLQVITWESQLRAVSPSMETSVPPVMLKKAGVGGQGLQVALEVRPADRRAVHGGGAAPARCRMTTRRARHTERGRAPRRPHPQGSASRRRPYPRRRRPPPGARRHRGTARPGPRGAGGSGPRPARGAAPAVAGPPCRWRAGPPAATASPRSSAARPAPAGRRWR